jgi:hypothetical protein
MMAIAVPNAYAGDRSRFGVAINLQAPDNPTNYDWAALGAKWFHAWIPYPDYDLSGLDFYPLVGGYGDLMGSETLESLQQQYNWRPQYYPPGTVWRIGSELQYDTFCTKNGVPLNPCRAVTADEYAQKFTKYQNIIRQLQPYGSTYKLAIGYINAVVEPGRPFALGALLDAYVARYGVPMPVDVFTVNSFGFGRTVDFEITFKYTIETYRQVMADKGFREKPLIATEVGVLQGIYVSSIPTSYVTAFLVQAFDWLLTARSDTTGMPSDDNRLVQRWAWFGFTGWHPENKYKWSKTALFDIDTKQITAVGLAYKAYVESLDEDVDVDVFPGWNLLSVPIELESYAITDVLASLDGSYDMAHTYDAQAEEWRIYTVGAPQGANTLTTVGPGDGLWVHATQADTWTVTGQELDSTQIPLYTGWNLIAYPVLEENTIADALSSIAGKYTAVYTYDPTQADPWLRHVADAPSWVSTLSDMTPGKGYWVNVNQDCTVAFGQ